jgi:hypothetical protein
MKRMVFAITVAITFSLVAGGLLIGFASAAAPGGMEKLSQALTSVKQAIAPLNNPQAVSASGLRNTALGAQPEQAGGGAANVEQTGGETFKQPKGGAYCDGTSETGEGTIEASGVISTTNHPKGDSLAQEFGVDYTEIIGWFCKGYGFGEISHAYDISKLKGVPVDEVFALRASGMGWGKIKQSYGLIGKPAHTEIGNGNGTGNGSGKGNNGNNGQKNGGNNGNKGNGNGKGNGHSKP